MEVKTGTNPSTIAKITASKLIKSNLVPNLPSVLLVYGQVLQR